MECLMQYLDDIEDLVFAAALVAESLRRIAVATILVSITLMGLAGGVLLALSQPPLALAVVTLLMVTLLYRATVNHPARAAARS